MTATSRGGKSKRGPRLRAVPWQVGDRFELRYAYQTPLMRGTSPLSLDPGATGRITQLHGKPPSHASVQFDEYPDYAHVPVPVPALARPSDPLSQNPTPRKRAAPGARRRWNELTMLAGAYERGASVASGADYIAWRNELRLLEAAHPELVGVFWAGRKNPAIARPPRANPTGRKKRGSLSTAAYRDHAYRGYLIRQSPINDSIWIEKDGFLISHAKSVADAQRVIAELTAPPGRNPAKRAPADPLGHWSRYGASLSRPKAAFKSARAAWISIGKATGLRPRHVRPAHTADTWTWVRRNPKSKPKRAPVKVARRELNAAVELFQKFREAKPRRVRVARFKVPKVCMVIGEMDFVGYTTSHAKKRARYRHDFSRAARPLLCASADGRQLLIFGGNYDFTRDGIVDRA